MVKLAGVLIELSIALIVVLFQASPHASTPKSTSPVDWDMGNTNNGTISGVLHLLSSSQ